MDTVTLCRTRREVVMGDRVGFRVADMHHPAGVAEATQAGAQPAELLLLLEEPRSGQERRRDPGERGALILAVANVHPPLDRDLEREASAGAELEESHSAGRAVLGREELDAAELGDVPNVAQQLGSRPPPIEELRHACALASR